MNPFRRLVVSAGLAWLILVTAPAALATVPQTLNYQGALTDASNQPVNATAIAPLQMTFKFFSGLTGGSALYTEQQAVIVTNGVFSVQIGSVTPLTLPFDVPYFLEITIGAEVLSPRQPLASAAYALRTGCIPGDRVTCFSFPTGTPGVGPCQTGVRVCNPQGTGFGACVGEVGPNCGSVCANLLTDNNNCGTCGHVCNLPQSCGGGGVAGQCGPALAACGNGIIDAGEQCDGANLSGQSCSTLGYAGGTLSCNPMCAFNVGACTAPIVCGNGLLEAGESCDDGNATNGDGCSSTCQVEQGFICSGTPSVCILSLANGNVCSSNSQCQSSFCVDGYCSNSACSATCFAANLPGSLGVCTAIPSGQSDSGVCSGTQACNGAGACLNNSGTACASNSQCISNFCTGGVCN